MVPDSQVSENDQAAEAVQQFNERFEQELRFGTQDEIEISSGGRVTQESGKSTSLNKKKNMTWNTLKKSLTVSFSI